MRWLHKFSDISKKLLIFLLIGITIPFAYSLFYLSRHLSLANNGSLFTILYTVLYLLVVMFGILNFFYERYFREVKSITPKVKNFVDRKEEIKEIVQLLDEGKNIFIWGQNGIGKTFLGKQITFILNKDVRTEKEYQIYFPKEKYLVFYLKVNVKEELFFTLETTINQSYSGQEIRGITRIKPFLKRKAKKRCVFILDNIEFNSKSEEVVENFISLFDEERFKFIIIAERENISLSLEATEISFANRLFTKVQIKEMKPTITDDMAEKIEKISDGIPVIIDFILNNDFVVSDSSSKNEAMKKVLNTVEESSPNAYQFLENNIFKPLVGEPIEYRPNQISLVKFLEEKALLSVNPDSKTAEVHNVIILILHEIFALSNIYRKNNFKKFNTKLKKKYTGEALVYLFGSGSEMINKERLFVIEAYNSIISTDEYNLLSLLYKLFVIAYNQDDKIDDEISTYAAYGQLTSLIGMGEYIEAEKFFYTAQKFAPLQINQANSIMDYMFLFKKADLSHMLNKYSEALEDLELLINDVENKNLSENFKEHFLIECNFLVAHIHGHMGDFLEEISRSFQTLCIMIKERYFKEKELYQDIYIKSLYGLICTRLTMHDLSFSYSLYFQELNEVATQNSSLKQRIDRHRAMYYRQLGGSKNLGKSKEILLKSLRYFESNPHRSKYTFHFALADIYREEEIFDEAIKEYSIAEAYAKKRQNKNLSTYSRLGILLCKIQTGNANINEIIEELKKILNICLESHLYIQTLQIRLVLFTLTDQIINKQLLLDELSQRGLHFEFDILNKGLDLKSLNKLQFVIR